MYLDPYLICERFNLDSSVKDMYTHLVILQILWYGDVVLIISWESIDVGDSFVFIGDDRRRFVHIFYCFEDCLVDFGWIYDRIWVFGVDVKGIFCGESIIDDDGSGGVFNATVVDRVFVIVGGDVWIGGVVAVVIFVVFQRILVGILFFWIIFCGVGNCSVID